jgi:H+/Cl- antiporter ClcA
MWILLWFVSGLIGSVFIALFNESHRSKTLTINEFAMMVIVALIGPIGLLCAFIVFITDWFEWNGHNTLFDWNKSDTLKTDDRDV